MYRCRLADVTFLLHCNVKRILRKGNDMKQERLSTKDVAETSASDERTSDVHGRCAEVLQRTGRESQLAALLRPKGRCDSTPGPMVQRLADTVDEFELDCKSKQTSRGFLSRWFEAK